MSTDLAPVPSPRQVLVLPGYGGSGPDHWQSRWERDEPAFVRVHQRDWENPTRPEWVAAIDEAVRRHDAPVLVAHSLACLAVAHWAAAHPDVPVTAALLVGVPDPTGPDFPAAALGFAPVPTTPLAFPSVVVASTDDPYATEDFSHACARAWGSRLVSIGAAGHVNADSGHGPWPQGRALLADLLTGPAA
ncbi:alpha/beta hydrolase [Kineosporia sp. R_H_3]|uniref:RBBP9/YdeN family alpha/beta hydrolase n=1 Tax=Kineosporia sp. R_H_3 TaxID=1961848 RepID=UPI000B4BC9E6|nr:alpha/beta hydrolase [Kineosporia sp. R_H_3]